MKIRIPDDDERKNIRNIMVRSDIGMGLKKWLKIQMDIEADDALMDALMRYFIVLSPHAGAVILPTYR